MTVPSTHTRAREPSARASFDILVVDDDAANLLAIEAALGELGSRLVKASSGAEALKRLLEQDFALILLDVRMEAMDGFETARLIRQRARSRHVPIIFVTAYGQSDARVLEGYELGAVDFLFKPIVPEVLRAKANVFVQLHERTQQVALQAELLRKHEREQAMRALDEERRAWEREALQRQMVEQQRATEELAKKAEELARTVAEREAAQRELTRINARLAEADRRKDEFLATLAHELRNPLAPISYAIGLLDGTPDPVLRQVRERVERQLTHLSRLVDDLLDVSRVTSGKVELRAHPMDLRDAIQHAVEVSRMLVDERQHRLTVEIADEPLPMCGDVIRLSQAVANLLNNAARYTPDRGTIELSARRDGGELVLEIADDGQGIEPELLDQIFGAFVQARAGGGGLGLGLHLVQHIVRMHGGEVRAHSDGVGLGARFEVRLPLAAGVELPGHDDDEGAASLLGAAPLSIVVIEDQEDVREMVVLLLEKWGYRVKAAGEGLTGVRLVVDTRPDVVLLDIGLPDVDGYAVASAIRSELDGACPALIAVTGWGQDHDRRRALEVGFTHHLVKPVSPRVLRSLLAEVGTSGLLAARSEESCRELEP